MNGNQENQMLDDVQNVNLSIGIENAKLIPLTQGKFATVDAEDYEWLNQFKWFAVKDTNTFYAARYVYAGYKKSGMMQMHRQLLGLKKYDGKIGDHRNRNGLDNRKENLRIASRFLNSYNTKLAFDNHSGYRGVCWNKVNNKWTARITVRNTVVFLGHFLKIVEAIKAYNNAALEYWGEDAFQNLLPEGHNESIIRL